MACHCVLFFSSMCMVCMWLHVIACVCVCCCCCRCRRGRPSASRNHMAPWANTWVKTRRTAEGAGQHWLPARWEWKTVPTAIYYPPIFGHHKSIYIFRWIRKALSNEVQFLSISSCFFILYRLVPHFAICVFARGMYTNMFGLNECQSV